MYPVRYKKNSRKPTPEYTSWAAMIQRCCNVNNPSYFRYGGRGILVDSRWTSFDNFAKDMGFRPEGSSLDRIDNNGNYYKDNCKWSTRKEQNNNQRDLRFITYKGETRNITQWAESVGLTYTILHDRIDKLGWDFEVALNTPKITEKTLTYKDKTLTLTEWSVILGVRQKLLAERIRYGWSTWRILGFNEEYVEMPTGL